MLMDKDLFSNLSILGIGGIPAGIGIWRNFKEYIIAFLQYI